MTPPWREWIALALLALCLAAGTTLTLDHNARHASSCNEENR